MSLFLDRLLALSGFFATEGDGRPMLPLLLGSVGEPVVGESSLLDRLEANLLPVFLSLTAPGLKPNSPPPMLGGAAAGFGCCLGSCVGAGGVYFLTPPIGGGGGGGGGAPPA